MRRSKIYEIEKENLQNILDTSCGYQEVLRKIGISHKGNNFQTLKKVIKEYGLSEDLLNINRKNKYVECAKMTHSKTKLPLEKILVSDSIYSSSKLFKRLIKEGVKDNSCEICGISEWNGKPITLQLHHIDGNSKNNQLINLMVLCPNCHSQTDNFCRKNKG